jgi:alkanesulfonate monooxygenase SsuD/methylene tetrahydromethanopterin reductase-like flavin-dependent oxidoreductase (luciferase family)
MRFGIFYELSVPRPFAPGVERAVYENALEQVRLADELGFDTVWAVEHHFLEEYSHCSAPELFLTACAMQTKRIRVGHGAVVCVPKMNHPVRIAERAAVLDILSGGRLELGTARSSTWTELAGFEIDPDTTKQTWDETIRALPRMWTEERFSWQGTSFSVPERAILPKPVQKPHPPLWVTASNPPTVELAARRGIGVAMFSFSDPAVLRPLVETYKANVGKEEPVGAFVYDKIMAIAPLFCLPDGDEARAYYAKGNPSAIKGHFSVYFDTIPHYAERLKHIPRPIPQTKLRELIRQAYKDPSLKGPVPEGPVEPDFLYQNGVCVGSPDEVARTVARYRDVGLDQLVFIPAVGWHVPHEKTLESIALVGEKVLPRFR